MLFSVLSFLSLALPSEQFKSFNEQTKITKGFPGSSMSESLSNDISRKYKVAVYLISIRGFGESDGKRGTSHSKEELWKDLRSFIRYFRCKHPHLPVILGGHFRSSGLVLNYAAWAEREPIDGCVFLSPMMSRDMFNLEEIQSYYQKMNLKVWTCP